MSSIAGMNPMEEKNDLCPTLSYTHRIYGFAGCLVLGFVFAILSWIFIFKQQYVVFGILFTMSNFCAVGGSMFLCGPLKQVKRMFEDTRLIATIVYLASMVLTLVAAFAIKIPTLVIVCAIIQYLALIWYGLSYIPYARTAIKNCFKGAVQV